MKSHNILTEETEKKLFEKTILPFFLAGESVTAMWIRHGGRSRAMTHLAQYSEYFGFRALGNYKIVLIDNDELVEKTPFSYFRLVFNSLNGKKRFTNPGEKTYFALKEKVKEMVSQNQHLILILGKFDELDFPSTFFNNLYNLWAFDKFRVHFIFPVTKNIFAKDIFPKYDQLKELLSQNIVYFPVFSQTNAWLGMDYFGQKYGYRTDEKTKETVFKFSGGHPSLIKACQRILSASFPSSPAKCLEFLSEQWEIKVILEDIWNSLEPEEQTLLKKVVLGNLPKNFPIPDRFLQLGMVKKTEQKSPEVFSPLLVKFIKELPLEKNEVSLNPQTGEILVGNQPPAEKISLQEYHLLINFLQKTRQVVSRDEIADILWNKSEEKYSDWAIDQIISQLRKKIVLLGASPNKLQTIRGRGYRWTG